MQPTITVDATQAYARFSPAGIPEAVRNNLRRLLPQLGKDIGSEIEHKLDSELRSRNSLSVKKEMHEDGWAVYIKIETVAPSKPMLPLWLEEGTRPHPIVAVNARALYFYWERIGRYVAFKRVMHPGFKGLHYTERTMEEYAPRTADTLDQATKGV